MTETSTITYTVGETSERTGFSVDTLRYYEREGLLDPPDRTVSGRRRYTEDDLEWLGLLSCLRGTGMPIGEMRAFAELLREGDGNWTARRRLLEAHRQRVLSTIDDLNAQLGKVQHKIDYYRGKEQEQQ